MQQTTSVNTDKRHVRRNPKTLSKNAKPLIGFIGQGFVGKQYADDFEHRRFAVVRYSMEEPYRHNKGKIKECDIVFIAVPTPTTEKGFDASIVEEVLSLVGKAKTAVIKSTLLPGTTERLQQRFSGIFIMHSPEFLRERTAAHDAAHPDRTIIGIPKENGEYRALAEGVLSILPRAPFEAILHAKEAELLKYAGNNFFYLKVVYSNMLFDLAQKLGCRWDVLRDALLADPRIGNSHMEPVHKSGHSEKLGRGAGGHCFIKDFAVFSSLYEELNFDPDGEKLLRALRDKNNALLRKSGKDIDLLEGVYGPVRSRGRS